MFLYWFYLEKYESVKTLVKLTNKIFLMVFIGQPFITWMTQEKKVREQEKKKKREKGIRIEE